MAFGSVVNIYGNLAITLVQLLSVPILVVIWGPEKYGLWVMLYTIPSYLLLGDLGFASAAMADIGWKLGNEDREGARRTYHSAKILGFAIGGGLMAVAGLTALALPLLIPADDFVGPHSALAVALMIVYSAFTLQKGFTLAGLRASGHFTIGMFLDYTVYLADGIAVIIAGKLGCDFAGCTAAILVSRASGSVLTWLLLRWKAPWLERGFDGASIDELKRLFRPAIGIGILPVGLAISLQGSTVILGALATPAVAAVFVSTRTLCRFVVQLGMIVNRISVPELAFAMGGRRQEDVARILLANLAVLLLVILPATMVLAVVGKEIVALWTLGRILPSRGLVLLLAVGALFHAGWWLAANLLTAVRLQTRFAPHFLIFSVIAMALSVPASWAFHSIGMAACLLLLDLAMLWRLGVVLTSSGLADPETLIAQARAIGGRLGLLRSRKSA